MPEFIDRWKQEIKRSLHNLMTDRRQSGRPLGHLQQANAETSYDRDRGRVSIHTEMCFSEDPDIRHHEFRWSLNRSEMRECYFPRHGLHNDVTREVTGFIAELANDENMRRESELRRRLLVEMASLSPSPFIEEFRRDYDILRGHTMRVHNTPLAFEPPRPDGTVAAVDPASGPDITAVWPTTFGEMTSTVAIEPIGEPPVANTLDTLRALQEAMAEVMSVPASWLRETPPPEPLTATQLEARRSEAWYTMRRTMLHDMVRPGAIDWFSIDEVGRFLRPSSVESEAATKGMALLKENLTPEQLASYEKNRYFDVIGGTTGTRYRIQHGCQMNIFVLDRSGYRVSGICFLPFDPEAPTESLVPGDCMLAQKMTLELAENEALRIANRF